MADIKIDEELLLRAGLGIGYAFAPFFRGILEGVEDYTIEQAAREMQEEHDAQEAEEGLKRPVEKNADRRLPEVLVRSMREAGTMRSLARRRASGRGTPVPLRRVRGRNALQAL